MAQTVHLKLTIDGSDIEGESSISSMEREGTIECSSFRYGIKVPREAGTGMSSGRRQHQPVIVHKRIDKTTPLLIKAICNNEPVDEAKFMFFRPHRGGDGSEQQFYTVILTGGAVIGVSQVSEDAIMSGEHALPMMEEITFNFHTIEWVYEAGGIIHSDSWAASRE